MRTVLNGPRDQFARTPKVLLDAICHMVNENALFDPCPVNPTFDGLDVHWQSANYCNPPFQHATTWARKAVKEHLERNAVTALLLPLRPETKYTHHDILPHTAAIVVWLQRVCFLPFATPLPEPVATYIIGRDGCDHASSVMSIADVDCGIVAKHKCTMRYWDLGTFRDSYDAKLLPRIRHAYGHDALYKLVLGSPKAALERAERECAELPSRRILLLTYAAFGHAYMAEHAHLVREVVLVRPALALSGSGRSFMGSVLLCLSGDAAAYDCGDLEQESRGRGVPCVLASLREPGRGRHIGDPEGPVASVASETQTF